ncbi:unnamed protein product [Didymodactylos carnosus]|uniref:EF-hand domain-containing protein n=1 Tax=Didymodactylos carnosus TaxID=1234261 RepID=A0A815LIX0_9BILA|nr:unnamed protein product [Didymodactylos carnosus]CAF4296275.1 unnamed protein product [Didymodactylos carnosus]
MSAAGNSSGLTPEEVEEIERSFREYDTNKNGSITPDEMKECLHKAGVTALDKEVDYILKRMDKNHSACSDITWTFFSNSKEPMNTAHF